MKTLRDVDRAEDLPVWEEERPRSRFSGKEFSLSIIIPALNEAGPVIDALESTRDALDVVERIVVDGGSCDVTAVRAEEWGARVVCSPAGRARQMNAGARASRGSVLLFLHADTRLPYGFEEHVRRTLSSPGTVAGAFRHAIDGDESGLRLIEHLVNFRSGGLAMPYGDQGIFLPAGRFQEAGMFPEIPIMEDFELMRRLRRLGRVGIAPSSAVSSSRRYRQMGTLRTTCINQVMIAGYIVGIHPHRLVRWYRS
jgi:rSAM/selenodomain-associated transferase 2